MANKQLVGKWKSNNQSTAVIMFNLSTIMPLYYVYNVKFDVAVVDPWPINRTSTVSQENNAAAAKPAQDKNVIMLYINLAMHSVRTSSPQLLKSFEVDSSHMPLSSEVKSNRMWSSRPWSTWGHFSLKSGHVSVSQRLACLYISHSLTIKFQVRSFIHSKDIEKY